MPEVSVNINGVALSGWKTVEITRSLEQLAHTFTVGYTAPLESGGQPRRIASGSACTVSIDKTKLLAGYVVDAQHSYDATTRSYSVSGASKTIDLVDCAAVHKTGQWSSATILQVARDVCAPFGITANLADGLPAGSVLRRFALQEGETAYETIERAARMRGFLLLTTQTGDLQIARPSAVSPCAVLKYGANILRFNGGDSWQDRFSAYTLKTQAAGDDNSFGEAVAAIKRTSTDATINRYRPTTIMAENEDSGRELQARADWECNLRTTRGTRVTYTEIGRAHV
jgi:prophage tail gpP-like protein